MFAGARAVHPAVGCCHHRRIRGTCRGVWNRAAIQNVDAERWGAFEAMRGAAEVLNIYFFEVAAVKLKEQKKQEEVKS